MVDVTRGEVGQDAELVEGEHLVLVYLIVDRDAEGAEVGPTDLTGASLRWQSGALVKTLGAGITVVGAPTDGVVQVSLVPADTNGIDVRALRTYELRMTDAAGNVTTVARGRLVVQPTQITS